MDIRERLRTAVDPAAARSSVAHLSPEEFFAALAENPKPSARKSHPVLALAERLACVFLMVGTQLYMQTRPKGHASWRATLIVPGAMMLFMILTWRLYSRDATREARRFSERRFPLLLVEKANALTQGFAAADLIRFTKHGAIDSDVSLAVRDALVRLLPLVTEGDALHFTRRELEFLRDGVAGGDARLKDPTPDDNDLAVACWLALSSLAGADAMDAELSRALRRDAGRVTERGRTEHLRAAASEFTGQIVTATKGQ